MGTKGLICVFYRGRFPIAQFTQGDGSPSVVGARIWNFISVPGNIARLKRGLEHTRILEDKERSRISSEVHKLEKWKSGLHRISVIREHFKEGKLVDLQDQDMSKMSVAELGRFKQWSKKISFLRTQGDTLEVALRLSQTCAIKEFWPQLSLDIGAGIMELAASATHEQPLLIQSGLQFALEAISCQWAYVVDLDGDRFDAFMGAVLKEDSVSTRFTRLGPSKKTLDRATRRKMLVSVPKLVKSFDLSELTHDTNPFLSMVSDIIGRSSQHDTEE
ncbi:hypothetical protein HYFRA_00013798 [Hymenoscyphus fraxineus]|uniref:Uncharacterized protein n=1 Tax=Hymenoscyphus fraxineus TaxID=746836 RepID=A0A9N9LBX3_9HELO|nr:hypothetical protein HYFRA_00013798 [Hymenoscyphus fraxineus]